MRRTGHAGGRSVGAAAAIVLETTEKAFAKQRACALHFTPGIDAGTTIASDSRAVAAFSGATAVCGVAVRGGVCAGTARQRPRRSRLPLRADRDRRAADRLRPGHQ